MITVAFDGLSVVGKSTVVKMTNYAAESSVIVKENIHDPYRESTAAVNRLIKQGKPLRDIPQEVSRSHPMSSGLLNDAFAYCLGFYNDYRTQSQAFLAYMFVWGRRNVANYVESLLYLNQYDLLLLDRWQRTNWAYQSVTPHYQYQKIRNLNKRFRILLPDVQFILSCPAEEIPKRRAFRDKIGRGTAGQMSPGREQEILPVFQEIYSDEAAAGNRDIFWVENSGEPSECIELQIRQAIPTYKQVEAELRKRGIRFKGEFDDSFWLRPEVLDEIYKYQTNKG